MGAGEEHLEPSLGVLKEPSDLFLHLRHESLEFHRQRATKTHTPRSHSAREELGEGVERLMVVSVLSVDVHERSVEASTVASEHSQAQVALGSVMVVDTR